ncbi:MAG TPA: glycine cleavage system aminomethyltransferase GcvT [Stellaceae bacterium]|nr:glycine cleavage system aminomethyltransferase GcvT [Stellaceae bacterium]
MSDQPQAPLQKTPLHALHVGLGARMVPFAGYEMPVQYPTGIVAEHLHTRSQAGLFDVSHMGQARLDGAGRSQALERLVPGDIQALKPDRMRYTLLTNATGGILDDLMVTNLGDHLHLVVNAACKAADVEHLKRELEPSLAVTPLPDRALLALQGPAAAEVLGRLAPAVKAMSFMTVATHRLADIECLISRSGYTGEDGFEISLPAEAAERLARRLLAEPEVKPIGLGARDTLRLEAGLCLYGHDIDQSTTPVEADLGFALGKRRREAGGFLGADVILRQLRDGTARKRVGVQPEGRAPARDGTEILDSGGAKIGHITSGGFGPSIDRPIAMGYIASAHAAIGTAVSLMVRGTPRPARVAPLPFVAHRYHRG